MIDPFIWTTVLPLLLSAMVVIGVLCLLERDARAGERRQSGDEILRQRLHYAARRDNAGYKAGYKVKDPAPITDDSPPDTRAQWLLYHLLSSTQWEQYSRNGWFHAGWYKGWPLFIGDGCVTWGKRRYCVYPNVAAPREDILIAQLLHARTRPGKLIRKGNRIN